MSDLIQNDVWKTMQQHLGYTDEELEVFKNNPRNGKIFQKWNELANKTVIFEVVKSHGCNIQHKVGDRFFFSASGFMVTNKCPKKICPFIMPSMARMMAVIQERIYEGVDPTPLFNHADCDDVGLNCGGWGKIVIEAKITSR